MSGRPKMKIFTETPVTVHSEEELKILAPMYRLFQKIQFVCGNCGHPSVKSLNKLKKNSYTLICHTCVYTKIRNSETFKEKMSNTLTNKTNRKPRRKRTEEEKRKSLEKYRQTCLQRFGCENAAQAETCKEKKRNTWKCKSEEDKKKSIEKYKKTCLARFGFENAAQSPIIKNKVKDVMLEKYGFARPAQSPAIKERIKQTNLKRLGVEVPAQSPIVQVKIKQTCIEKYGIPHVPNFRYTYNNLSFDSSWELAVWIWAKDFEKDIKREPVVLTYNYNGKLRNYFPDFEIDGQLIEVKGSQFFKQDGTMRNPFNRSQDGLYEAKHQCGLRNGVQFWSEKEITHILKYINSTYGPNYLQSFAKTSNPLTILTRK